MAGSQSFSKRVLIPLGAISLTVAGLSVMGMALWNMGDASSITTGPAATGSSSPSAPATTNGYLPVNVFNSSDISGLARKTASQLQEQNWTVKTIGNWSGITVQQSTVFYPADEKDSAVALAAELRVQMKVATSSMSQSELTYVIAK